MEPYEYLQFDVADGCAEIILDRPDLLNAFNAAMIDELVEAVTAAQSADDVYVIVLSGAGRGFCSGADVSGMEAGEQTELEAAVRLWKVQRVVRNLLFGPKPTIAAVNGPAIGAGCGFALGCDLRIIESDAFMREQFVNIGLIPGDGDGWILPRLVGESKAKEYILTGRDITPDDAEEMGLVVDVVEPGESLDAARDLAAEIRDKPALAVQRSKQLIDSTQSFEEYGRAAIEAQWEVKNHPEHEEAVRALREGREPNFDRNY